MGSNIQSSANEAPVWDPTDPTTSIQKLRNYAEALAIKAIAWYYSRKRRKVWLSTWCRFAAIALTALGGLIPILSSLLYANSADAIARLTLNQWGYLSVGLAGFSLALDRYYGASSGWMRYISAAMVLETLLEEFRIDWNTLRADAGASDLDAERRAKLLNRVKTFTLAIRAQVERETQAWISEFQSNLAQLEKETKEALSAAREQARKEAGEIETARREAADAQRVGAIDLTVKATGLDDGFSVELDGKVYRKGVTGKTCGVVNVPPGLHDLVVTASANRKPLLASKVVRVPGAGVEQVVIELT